MFTMSDILKWHKRLTPFSDALNINNHLCVLRFLGLSRSPKSLLWLLSVSEELFIKLLLTLLSSSSLLISLINGLVQAFLVCTPEHSPLSLGPEIVRPDPLPLLSPPFFGAPLPCPPLIPLFPPLAPLPPLLDLTDANPGFGVLVVIFRAFFFGILLSTQSTIETTAEAVLTASHHPHQTPAWCWPETPNILWCSGGQDWSQYREPSS